MIICVYILQFVQPKFRQVLINKIFKSLNWGGVLVLVEKIRGNDARFQDILTFLHHDYKKRKGFKTDEIYNKEISLSDAQKIESDYEVGEEIKKVA